MEFLEFVTWFEWGTLCFITMFAAVEAIKTGMMIDLQRLVDFTIALQAVLVVICIAKYTAYPLSWAFMTLFLLLFGLIDEKYNVLRNIHESLEKPSLELTPVNPPRRLHDSVINHTSGSNTSSELDEFDSVIISAQEKLEKLNHLLPALSKANAINRTSGSKTSSELDEFDSIIKSALEKLEAFKHLLPPRSTAKLLSPQKAVKLLPSPETGNKHDACILFRKLPLELRRLIYGNLLVTGIINNPDKLLTEKLTCFVYNLKDKRSNGLNLDVSILRTCRRIYDEALPMLYEENSFAFCSSEGMSYFREKGLVEKPDPENEYLRIPAFNFEPTHHGRFSLIRKLIVNLTDPDALRRAQVHLPIVATTNRDALQLLWRFFLNENLYDEDVRHTTVRFPALTDLTLNFKDWNLTEYDMLIVRPFVDRFRTEEKLLRLEIKGVLYRDSLLELRKQMLAEDGMFVVS